MKRSTIQRNIRFDAAQYARLEELGRDQSRTITDLVRIALEGFLTDQKRAAASELRHLRVAEYSQLALDTIIRENHPELREAMVAETDRRMERYHGAR